MSLIANLFGRSPIRPMQVHMKAAADCARVIPSLLEAMAAGDLAAIDRARTTINELEHQADELKHEIRIHLPKRLFMAVERHDMLEILDSQDSIADVAQDVAEMAAFRQMKTPSALREPLAALANSALATCGQSESVVNELDELIETGFGRHEVARVEEMISRLNDLESEADERGEEALKALFSIEDEIGVGSYYWYQIINWIGDIADYAERTGNRIRLLIAS
ncbi:MAG: TIGR00153 family protein [bacterium]|nr:TIGR00153 family protein [bacterium]